MELIKDTRKLGSTVRLIDTREGIPEDEKNRVVDERIAFRLRNETGLDLVLIATNNGVPVVKLCDYGKLCYERDQRERIAKRNAKGTRGVKEFVFRPGIAEHDFQTKLTHIRESLDKHYDVRITVRNNRATRSSMKRGQSMFEASREKDFVLNRVIEVLGDQIQPTRLSINEGTASAILKKSV